MDAKSQASFDTVMAFMGAMGSGDMDAMNKLMAANAEKTITVPVIAIAQPSAAWMASQPERFAAGALFASMGMRQRAGSKKSGLIAAAAA